MQQSHYDVVLVFPRWEELAPATTVTAANLNIGDIVISDKLSQHDMDGRPIMTNRHEIPLTGITFFQADRAMMAKAMIATEGLLTSLSQKYQQKRYINLEYFHLNVLVA